jgi:hypothetical protein
MHVRKSVHLLTIVVNWRFLKRFLGDFHDARRHGSALHLTDLLAEIRPAFDHFGDRLTFKTNRHFASVRYKAAMALLEMGRKFRDEADLGHRVTALEEAQGQQPPTREERFE